MHSAGRGDRAGAQLVTQGQFAVSSDPEAIIRTLLGSCVSCCLWDEGRGVGGMNHLLLAGGRRGADSVHEVAGVAEMECLIDGIVRLGGRRDRLKAKVFGGARMLDSPTTIGETNARFLFDYLKRGGIACVNSSVGGTEARALRFWPASGRVIMRLVKVPEIEAPGRTRPPAGGSDLRLF